MKVRDKVNVLLNKLDCYVEDIESQDFHFIPGILISCALEGRILIIKNNRDILERYFRYSPEIFKYIKDYKFKKLCNLCEKIIKSYHKFN